MLALHLYFLVILKVKKTNMIYCFKKKDMRAQHFCIINSIFPLFICEDIPIFIHMEERIIPDQYNRIVYCRTTEQHILLTSFWELELLLLLNEKPAVSRAADLLLFGHLLLADSMFCCLFKRIAFRNVLDLPTLFSADRWPSCSSP